LLVFSTRPLPSSGSNTVITSAEVAERENKESLWDAVSSQVSTLLQEDDPELPSNVRPFDAASDIDIDEQKAFALYRIQLHLKSKRAAPALALLRASRYFSAFRVW